LHPLGSEILLQECCKGQIWLNGFQEKTFCLHSTLEKEGQLQSWIKKTNWGTGFWKTSWPTQHGMGNRKYFVP
jgi:hypothetical protein